MEIEAVIADAAGPADLPTVDGAGVLSAREREVVALLAKGRSNREIGEELVISPRTVDTHVTNVLNKLGVRTRAQVAVWAVAHGVAETTAV